MNDTAYDDFDASRDSPKQALLRLADDAGRIAMTAASKAR